MSTDQQKPMTKRLPDYSKTPGSNGPFKILATAAMVVSLLGLSSITFTGTVVALVLSTPLLVLFSPILVPAGGFIFITIMALLFSGACGVAAMSAFAWAYSYLYGKHPPGADKFDYARMKIASTAKDVKDKAKEYGRQMQHKAEELTQGS